MNGWDEFLAWVARARVTMEDRWAPVALITLQYTEGEGGTVDVEPHRDAAILWPSTFPVDERGPLLARLAGPYRQGTVLREREEPS
jgi:hypothetical protein